MFGNPKYCENGHTNNSMSFYKDFFFVKLKYFGNFTGAYLVFQLPARVTQLSSRVA